MVMWVMTAQDRRQLRTFGLTVGGILALIGTWPLAIHGETVRWWTLVPGVILVTLGVAAPAGLAAVYRIWMKAGYSLGWVNTRIILGIVFYGLITPIGLAMRWLGRDPMRRSISTDCETYRVARSSRPCSHLNHQY